MNATRLIGSGAIFSLSPTSPVSKEYSTPLETPTPLESLSHLKKLNRAFANIETAQTTVSSAEFSFAQQQAESEPFDPPGLADELLGH